MPSILKKGRVSENEKKLETEIYECCIQHEQHVTKGNSCDFMTLRGKNSLKQNCVREIFEYFDSRCINFKILFINLCYFM
jgi:hypothetical protein